MQAVLRGGEGERAGQLEQFAGDQVAVDAERFHKVVRGGAVERLRERQGAFEQAEGERFALLQGVQTGQQGRIGVRQQDDVGVIDPSRGRCWSQRCCRAARRGA